MKIWSPQESAHALICIWGYISYLVPSSETFRELFSEVLFNRYVQQFGTVEKASVTGSGINIERWALFADEGNENSFWNYDDREFFDSDMDDKFDFLRRRAFSFSLFANADGDGDRSGRDGIPTIWNCW